MMLQFSERDETWGSSWLQTTQNICVQQEVRKLFFFHSCVIFLNAIFPNILDT